MGQVQIDARKKDLRARLLEQRKALGEEARALADAAIAEQVKALRSFQETDVLLTYLGVGAEVDTLAIIQAAWARGMVVALPRCVPHTRQMRWYRVTSFDGLVRSPFGVLEPAPSKEDEQLLNTGQCMVAIVPGLTFDVRGYRLGYGGGFYDTFLADFDGASVGLCRRAQASDDLVALGVIGEHDVAVDFVVWG